MPKYLVQGSYTLEGLKGLIQDGGTGRREAVEKLAQSIGGKVEGFYYAFGDDDVFMILDVPDNVTMAAASIMVNATGAGSTKTVVLLTPEEIDQAAKATADYRPPGG